MSHWVPWLRSECVTFNDFKKAISEDDVEEPKKQSEETTQKRYLPLFDQEYPPHHSRK
jgi:hypothetical protein